MTAAHSFAVAIHPEVQAERRRAFRALLRRPLLSAAGETAEEFKLVRRHSDWLAHWLAQFPSWSLHVHRDFVRLRKLPADLHDQSRPAIDRKSGTAFTRRRYALFCLALAVLEQSNRQTTLGRIAQSIVELIANDRELQSAGLSFDIANHDQRRDLVHAIRLLMDTGVLSLLDGDEKQFLNKADSSDVLYAIHRHVLAEMLQAPRGPSAVEATAQKAQALPLTERAAKLLDQAAPATEAAFHQKIRSRLMRALLDDPILYFQDLDPAERDYFEKNQSLIFRQVHEATGLVAEHRAEGVAMVDDAAELSDLHLPGESSDGPLYLRLVEWFAAGLRNGADLPIPVSRIEEQICDWRLDIPDSAIAQRTQDALFHLRSLRLVRFTAGGIVPLAPIGRWFNTARANEE
jgi:uncharacterized protein (TIGR02678 family)